MVDSVLVAGIALFSFSSLFFLFYKKMSLNTAFLVSFTTLASYLVMFEGRFVSENSLGEELYWTRWIGYALSCSLLVYTIAQKLKFKPEETANAIMLNIFVMVTGALASVYESYFMLAMFILGGIAYMLMVLPILKSKNLDSIIKTAILLGWSAFPIIFLLSPEGYSIISNFAAFVIYIILDFATKIFFYIAYEMKGK